jgi:hypothetical protein
MRMMIGVSRSYANGQWRHMNVRRYSLLYRLADLPNSLQILLVDRSCSKLDPRLEVYQYE